MQVQCTESKVCVGCGAEFSRGKRELSYVWNKRQYCAKRCEDADRARQKLAEVPDTLPSGTVGALCELQASADLLRRGYAVFRAVSPACSCDLIAMRQGGFVRVEVRQGYMSPSGKLVFPQSGKDVVRSDVYAVVVDGMVFYEPQGVITGRHLR